MKVSIVIPVYNEEANIPLLYFSLKKVMDGLGFDYEVIFIDDGSKDGSPGLLEEIQKRDKKVMVVTLRRNFGQTAALAAGFDYARGDVIVTMDGDMQNDPEDTPGLLEKIKDFDLVSGWRRDRKDPLITRRLPSMVVNWFISRVTGVSLHDYGCTLKAYRRDVVKGIRLYGEMRRFIPAVASWMGVSVGEVEVTHHPRRFGRSKYGVSRVWRVILDLITVRFLQSFSTRPIHAFGPIGFLMVASGFLISLYLTYEKLILGYNIGGRPLLLGVLLIILGVQLVVMGLLGGMLARIYHESQGKPIYVIKKAVSSKQLQLTAYCSRQYEKGLILNPQDSH